MHADRPIHKSSEDKFERKEFADQLADILLLPAGAPSLVVGLEGGWGSGKSSVLAMVKARLETRTPKPIIVEFNPWLLASLDSVVEGFLVQLASKLGTYNKAKNAKDTAKTVLSFAKLLRPIKFIPGAEPWATLVTDAIESVGSAVKAASKFGALDLAAHKQDVQEALKNIEKPIVVIIDDVDRLPPEEVRIIFQLVKAVADFERVAYLVAYDPDPVAKALSYDGVYEGTSYLEKVIQLTYSMPRFAYGHRRNYLEASVKTALHDAGIKLTKSDNKLLDEVYSETSIIRALKQPRDIVRLTNKFRMALNCIKNEVTPGDLLVYTCLELRFPAVVKEIAENPHRFVTVFGEDYEVDHRDMLTAHMEDSKDGKEQSVSYVDRMLLERVSSEADREIAKSLVQHIFPKLEKKNLGNRGSLNRLRNRNGLLKVLHHCSPSFTLPMSELKRFLQKPTERRQMLRDYLEGKAVGALLGMMTQMPEGERVVDLKDLADCLMDGLKGPSIHPNHENYCRAAGDVLYQLIIAEVDPGKRWDSLVHALTKREGMYVGESVILHLLSQYGVWSSGEYAPSEERARRLASSTEPFTYDQIYKLKDIWLNTIKQAVAETDFLRTQSGVLSMLFRWGQLTLPKYSEPRAFVEKQIQDHEWLSDFLKKFVPGHDAAEIARFVSDVARLAKRLRTEFAQDPHAQAIAGDLERIPTAQAQEVPAIDPGVAREATVDAGESEEP